MVGSENEELKSIPGLTEEEKSAASTIGDVESSTAEAQQLTSGKSKKELQKEALQRDHERSENFKDHFEIITVAGLYIMAIGVFSFAAIWAWHTLTPECWHWLNPSQLDNIQNIVTGGVRAGIIADQFRRRIG
ncbi:hypothetical protein [Hyphococcus sp.]|uniref:hypothetical protein n=1 Tax=Hyphococcus sp. TaxID=2038636 RepID=UPI00208A5305|nr:MAG: hypothetical protein DHS20C04_05950 [Marinicaulis sp.]